MTTHTSPDPAARAVHKLRFAGERLPDRTRTSVLVLREAAIPPLLGIISDRDFALGPSYAPIHAVGLLADLRAEAAIAPMLELLAATEWDELLHDAIVQALPRLGAAVVEPALAAYAKHAEDEFRDAVSTILAELGVRDDRILSVLRKQLALDAELGAGDVARYGDPRALDDLGRAFDEYELADTDNPFCNQTLVELAEAIETLGGTLTPRQARKYDRAMEPYERWRKMRVAARMARPSPPSRAERPGRNELCWCGSTKKYKKCHLDADEPGAGAQP